MRVRFDSHEDALVAVGDSQNHLGSLNAALQRVESNLLRGLSNQDEKEFFLWCIQREKSHLRKINTWLEDQEKRLAKKKELDGKKRVWNQTLINKHKVIRKARRDARDFKEARDPWLDEQKNYVGDKYRHLNVDIETSRQLYNDKYEPYEDHEEDRAMWAKMLDVTSEPHEENACYECSGICRQYEEYEYDLGYGMSDDMRQDDYPADNGRDDPWPDLEDDDCFYCGVICTGDCVDDRDVDEVFDDTHGSFGCSSVDDIPGYEFSNEDRD